MISVIIPTYNRAGFLSAVLKSIATQGFPTGGFEVIVVDNGSTDHTPGIVAQFSKRLSNLRYFYEARPGLHAARHRGLEESSGEVLVYIDDDIRAAPGWLEAIAENFSDPDVAMVGGNNCPDFQGPVPGWLERLWARPALGGRAIVYLSIIALPEGRREFSPYLVWGCNFAVRRKVVLDAGGFHPDSMPGELVRFRGDGETHIARYVLANGLRCNYDSRASVYHAVTPGRMTFDYFRQRAYNQGVSDSYTGLRGTVAQRVLSGCRAGLRRLLGEARSVIQLDGEGDPELRELHALTREGYREGFAWHRKVYRDDPEVRAWVHRPHYFQEPT